MKIIPAVICQQAGIIVPVHMSETAYSKIMGRKSYLAILSDASEMRMVLGAAAVEMAVSESTYHRFTVPFDWAHLEMRYHVTEDDEGQVFMEIRMEDEGI